MYIVFHGSSPARANSIVVDSQYVVTQSYHCLERVRVEVSKHGEIRQKAFPIPCANPIYPTFRAGAVGGVIARCVSDKDHMPTFQSRLLELRKTYKNAPGATNIRV